jgi:NAD(P)-dependent dehydrogenase (short-subunit alcohol dehydrogenase family)
MSSVIVTGAAGALGSVLVRHLAAEGRQVVALDRPHGAARFEQLAKVAGVTALELDAQSPTAWRNLLDELARQDRAPNGAVLVAGGFSGGKRLDEEEGDETWRKMLGSNLETVRVALQALLPTMVAARQGSIVVIGSRAAERPWESAGAAAYATSKAAVVALIRAVAAEVLLDGVRINAVLPSTIDTPANRAGMPKADFSRWVSPESLSAVIAFLLSESARDISGAAIPVYGRVDV